MKRILYIFSVVLTLQACQEVPPIIPSPNLDSERKVLMEEFSGGSCKPCAAAKADIDNLLAIYGENLIVVTMHTKEFPGVGDPGPGAQYDFRTDYADQLLNNLGLPLGIPSAYIDRTIFDGEPDMPLARSQWAGFVAKALEQDPGMGLNLVAEYDANTRELVAKVTMVPSVNFDAEVKLNVLLTENKLIDVQETDDGLVEDYQHDHIFRATLSSLDGDLVAGPLVAGNAIEKSYTFTLPEEDGWWVAENINVVAFTSINDGDDRTILQADEVYLSE